MANKPVVTENRAQARRKRIISEAARQFVTLGFEGTSIRDIAAAAGIMGGSLYYHFASKEELFVAVHAAGMDMIEKAVRTALVGIDDPWRKLEAVASAHCEALLAESDLGAIVTPHFAPAMTKIRPELVAQRDRYEKLIKSLIADLDLPADIPPNLFRLYFLGALNWMPTWYRAKRGSSPAAMGALLVRMLRDGSHPGGAGVPITVPLAAPAKRVAKPRAAAGSSQATLPITPAAPAAQRTASGMTRAGVTSRARRA